MATKMNTSRGQLTFKFHRRNSCCRGLYQSPISIEQCNNWVPTFSWELSSTTLFDHVAIIAGFIRRKHLLKGPEQSALPERGNAEILEQLIVIMEHVQQ